MSTSTVYSVPAMSCDHCVASITEQHNALEGVDSVSIDLEAKSVTVTGGTIEAVTAAIDEAGFDVEGDPAEIGGD